MLDALRGWTARQKHVVTASYLGWTLDAMDFFLLVFVFNQIAAEFHTTRGTVALATTLTLGFRPVGAFIFGRLADRFGRRPILMFNIAVYSIFSASTAFVPDLTSFFIVRSLFGIGMGGVWGIGASLSMETIKPESRGVVSGLLQSGYCSGYLIAAAIYALVFAHVGWRGIFLVGLVPSLLLIPYVWFAVEESPLYKEKIRPKGVSILTALRQNWQLSLYCIVMMTVFNHFSHGSQDFYPNYMQYRGFTPALLGTIAILYNIGGILGCWLIASLSQKYGRRRTMIVTALLAIPTIVPFAFSDQVPLIILGTIGINFFVQGCWSVMPAHLNELAPAGTRGTFPGTVYQLGNLFASGCLPMQIWVQEQTGDYGIALASVPLAAA
ncbi:MAG TPA: MFS transporter, partial [Rhizomicrobium sp.]|nr:MFS transporter [Rhizomicrobium sp.]